MTKVEQFLSEPITQIQYQALMFDIGEIRASHERLLQWIIAMNAGMSTMAQQELDKLAGRSPKTTANTEGKQ